MVSVGGFTTKGIALLIPAVSVRYSKRPVPGTTFDPRVSVAVANAELIVTTLLTTMPPEAFAPYEESKLVPTMVT
jgi:hypothetical protein